MKLREIAYARSGDKGDIVTICVYPYQQECYEFLRKYLTAERIKEHFRHLVRGRVTRYEVDSLRGLNFVLEQALDGGVSMSLRADPHGKAFASFLLDMEIGAGPRQEVCRRRQDLHGGVVTAPIAGEGTEAGERI